MIVFPITYLSTAQYALVVKNPPANEGNIRDTSFDLDHQTFNLKGIATHSSILA